MADDPQLTPDQRLSSERAFVDSLNRKAGEAAAPLVVFGIPLKAKTDPVKWDIVQRNLRATLANIHRQTDPNFIVVVAGHHKPELGPHGGNICWIEANWEPPESPAFYTHDKLKKRRLILSLIRRSSLKNFYFFTFDADDYIDQRVCEYIRSDHNRAGYYIDKGYIYDVSTGTLGETTSENSPFYKYCGSCVAFWLTTNDLPRRATDTSTSWTEVSNNHKFIPETMAAAGRPLAAFPFPAGLYFVNHGASNVEEKGTSDNKSVVAYRTRIRSETRVRNVLKRFAVRGVPPVAPSGGAAMPTTAASSERPAIVSSAAAVLDENLDLRS